MATERFPTPKRPRTPARALLYGGLTVGTLDLLDAFLFFGVIWGLSPLRILHSIASGLLGRAASEDGLGVGLPGALFARACRRA